jgi:hypothetical protein
MTAPSRAVRRNQSGSSRVSTSEPEFSPRPNFFVPGIAYDHVSTYLARYLYRGLVAVGREPELVGDLAEPTASVTAISDQRRTITSCDTRRPTAASPPTSRSTPMRS